MAKDFKLRKHLLLSFFIALSLIGAMQIIINAFLGDPIRILADSILKLENTTGFYNINGIGPMALRIILILMIGSNLGEIIAFFDTFFNTAIKDVVDESMMNGIESIFRNMSPDEITMYYVRIILLLLLITLIWLLPFISVGVVFAIFTSKKIKQEEHEKEERVESYEQQRNLLLTDMAHDIKTPMTTIAGYSKALAEGNVPKENIQEYLNVIYGKTMQANELVSILFEYVKLDSAGFTFKTQQEDICEIVRECVANMYMDYEKRGIEIIADIPERSSFIFVDKLQIKRAINNLLINSYKHNPTGTVTIVTVRENKNEIEIDISDNGSSIAREIGQHIFDPFVQSDKSRTSGSGLGLSVAKKIIDMHNGKIVLFQYLKPDKEGIVKTFKITLPRTKEENIKESLLKSNKSLLKSNKSLLKSNKMPSQIQ